MIKLAISPCPNDTFAFYYFIRKLMDNGICVDYLDIEELNQSALTSKYDIVKASYAIYPEIENDYSPLQSGSAIGENLGPVLVSAHKKVRNEMNRVLLPGIHTTASVLFDFFVSQEPPKNKFKQCKKSYAIFSDIIPSLKSGQAEYGVIIHEGRFIYASHDLKLEQDLGEYWVKHTGYSIPLGGVFVHKRFPPDMVAFFNSVLKESIAKAHEHFIEKDGEYYNKILPFVRSFAQEQSDTVIENHISTYVTSETVSLSERGEKSIQYFTKHLQNQTKLKI